MWPPPPQKKKKHRMGLLDTPWGGQWDEHRQPKSVFQKRLDLKSLLFRGRGSDVKCNSLPFFSDPRPPPCYSGHHNMRWQRCQIEYCGL
jgi:hypothetical protein